MNLGPAEPTEEDEIGDLSHGGPHLVVLGAGASVAAMPNGDAHGRRLPVMANFAQVLGLEQTLREAGFDPARNFEDLYSTIHADPDHQALRSLLESLVWDYFAEMRLPHQLTIYDHLLLSLRPKDYIATFNWDPFLWDAWLRCYPLVEGRLPQTLFLHGNVRVGFCLKDRVKSSAGAKCRHCGVPLQPSPLLYPVADKDYATNPYLGAEWATVREVLKRAYLVTIFGYGAPKTDAEAIRLFSEAWGAPDSRALEEFEFIDIADEDTVVDRWEHFIHTRHFQYTTDYYASWGARHPRRSCEALWSQLMDASFVDDHAAPRFERPSEYAHWLGSRIAVERAADRESG